MSPRQTYWAILGFLLLCNNSLIAAAVWYLISLTDNPELLFLIPAGGVVVGFALSLLLMLVWAALDFYLLHPMAGLQRGVEIIAHTNPAHEFEIPDRHLLGSFPAALSNLAEQLHAARSDVGKALQRGARDAERQKQCLQGILRELDTAVLYCDIDARIQFYNCAATRLLDDDENLGLGRSVMQLLNPAPLRQTLDDLRARIGRDDGRSALSSQELVVARGDGARLLRLRVALVPLGDNRSGGFLLSLDEASGWIRGIRERDRLLLQIAEQLRGPLASLRAAAENRQKFTRTSTPRQGEYDAIVVAEAGVLSERIEAFDSARKSLLANPCAMADVNSADLALNLRNRLQAQQLRLVATGRPLWLHCDAQALIGLLEHLLCRLRDYCRCDSVDFAASMGDRRVYIDLIWRGSPVPETELGRWSMQRVSGVAGVETAQDIVDLHNGNLWSQQHRQSGMALLRIPAPASKRQWQSREPALPRRPEVYDFDLRPQHDTARVDCPLCELEYVVFDSETTGLQPSAGDEIVSLAGVRIVNGRILSGEVFDELVNPGRSIPATSTRFHRIEDHQVRDCPPLSIVLPRFRKFIGDAALVAHNAAFDLKFFSMQREGDLDAWPNSVLDVLLLSVFLHDHTADHSLEGIARRLGVDVRERHTALGDAMVTAEIYLRMIDLLRARGVNTLGQALAITEAQIDVRKQQTQF